MRLRDEETLSPEAERDLAALDAALAGRPVPEDEALAELARDLRAERPVPEPRFGAELDERAAEGFRGAGAGGALARLRERLAATPPRRCSLPPGPWRPWPSSRGWRSRRRHFSVAAPMTRRRSRPSLRAGGRRGAGAERRRGRGGVRRAHRRGDRARGRRAPRDPRPEPAQRPRPRPGRAQGRARRPDHALDRARRGAGRR